MVIYINKTNLIASLFFRKFINRTWLLFFFPEEFGGSRISILTLSLSLAFKRSCQQPCWRKHEPRQLSPQCIDICMGRIVFVNNCYKNEQEGIIYSSFSFWLANMRNVDCLFCVDYLCIYKPIKKTINILSRDIYKNCFFSLCNCYIYYSFWFFSIFSNIVFHI